jgi:HD superfamily phosphohydrolase
MEKTNPNPSDLFCRHAMVLSHLLSPELEKSFDKLGDKRVGLAIMNLLKNLISGPIDADKMDYLLRDSHFSGCLTGVYDFDYLLNNMRIGIEKKYGTPQIFLAINKKALGGLEDFFYSRFHMYSEIYSHKTYAGFKFILSKALSEVLSVPANASQLKYALTDIVQFEKFTDAFFWERFRQHAEKNPSSFCSRLLHGRKLKHIHEKRLPVADNAKKRQEKEIVKLRNPGRHIETWNEAAKFSTIKGPFEQLKLRTVNNGRVDFEEVAGESPFIKEFKDQFKYHFYLID